MKVNIVTVTSLFICKLDCQLNFVRLSVVRDRQEIRSF
jgi:hypothetical protein